MIRPLNVGVCPDFAEERWPSMDRVAGNCWRRSARHHAETIAADAAAAGVSASARCAGRPAAWRTTPIARATDSSTTRAISGASPARTTFTTSSITATRTWRGHSRPSRTVVTCHDLDAFRSIVDGRRRTPIGAVPRGDAVHPGGSAAGVARSPATRAAIADELMRLALVAPERVFVAHLGVGEQFTSAPDPDGDASLARLLPFHAQRAGGAARRQH